ncbi:hypothetical protein Bbelb_136780 [Branchiostoma belcheri]|nr:hypothetical protein Bbelb_136780 [Branchiostoma belcheri]
MLETATQKAGWRSDQDQGRSTPNLSPHICLTRTLQSTEKHPGEAYCLTAWQREGEVVAPVSVSVTTWLASGSKLAVKLRPVFKWKVNSGDMPDMIDEDGTEQAFVQTWNPDKATCTKVNVTKDLLTLSLKNPSPPFSTKYLLKETATRAKPTWNVTNITVVQTVLVVCKDVAQVFLEMLEQERMHFNWIASSFPGVLGKIRRAIRDYGKDYCRPRLTQVSLSNPQSKKLTWNGDNFCHHWW